MQLKRKLGPLAFIAIIICYWFVIGPLRYAFHDAQYESEWWADYKASQNEKVETVKVTKGDPMIYIRPGDAFIGWRKKVNYFALLKEGVYLDSLRLELKKYNRTFRRRYLYISVAHKHWFKFVGHEKFKGGYINPMQIDSQQMSIYTYIDRLKNGW